MGLVPTDVKLQGTAGTEFARRFHIWYKPNRSPGGKRMAGYRLYFMDRFSGHIEHRREFLAEDDAVAFAIAESWSTGQPMELWLGSRKLKRWEPAPLDPD